MPISRRSFVAACSGAPLLAGHAGALDRPGDRAGEAADWPQWAPTRRQLYDRIARDVARRGVDIREFGARLDGSTDDTDAMERALASGRPVIVIPGHPGARMRLTRALQIAAPVTIVGVGGRPVISVENPEQSLFAAAPAGNDPARFLRDVRLDNLAFDRPAPLRAHGKALTAHNLRGVSVTRCSAVRMGLLGLHHMLQKLDRYRRSRGTIETDPAVLAGFSPTRPDDLNEDALVYDCEVDAGSHASQLARFDFTRRIAVAHCQGRFASVSWWGGGGRREEGGDLAFLRRARDIYVCDNRLSGSIGGVYGNNGQGILVARNHVSMVTDIGIDFEGCIDAVARDNVVENAGNFCYATLFAAKNVLFERNVAIQDGSATDIHKQYGVRKVGSVTGRTLFAVRSAGFAGAEGAVEVAYRDNRFIWRGETGVGRCLAGAFDRLELSGNAFENVICPLAYRMTQRLEIRNNRWRFTGRDLPDRPLITGSGGEMVIAGNAIAADRALQGGQAAILAQLSNRTRSVRIEDNRIAVPGEPAIEVRGHRGDDGSGEVLIAGNTGAAIAVPQGRDVSVRDNRGPNGAAAPLRHVTGGDDDGG